MASDKQERAYEAADKYAKSKGFASADALMQHLKDGLNSTDKTDFSLTFDVSRGVVEDLTKLILEQEIYDVPHAPYLTMLNEMFSDGMVTAGNAKVYDLNKPTGTENWDRTKYIPSGTTTTSVDQFMIKMYNENKTLSDQGYQFKKPVTYIAEEWIPYFKAGNLSGFIASLQADITKTKEMYIFHKLASKVSEYDYKNAITGTATNAFDCYVNEIIPAIYGMLTYSKKYNVAKSQNSLGVSLLSDLVVFASPKTITTLRSGLRTQLMQANLLNIGSVLDETNIFNLGAKFVIGNTTQDIDTSDDFYIDDNTIIVLNKTRSVKWWKQINRVETQSFAENMSTTVVSHEWGALDMLPWGQGFKYTNTNLNTLP